MPIKVEMLHRINLVEGDTTLVVTKMPDGIEIVFHNANRNATMHLSMQDFAEFLTECDLMLDTKPTFKQEYKLKVQPIPVPDYIKNQNYLSDEDRAKIAVVGGGQKAISHL